MKIPIENHESGKVLAQEMHVSLKKFAYISHLRTSRNDSTHFSRLFQDMFASAVQTASACDNGHVVYDEEKVRYSCTDLIYELKRMRRLEAVDRKRKRVKCASFDGTQVVLADHSEFCMECRLGVWNHSDSAREIPRFQTSECVLSVCEGATAEEIVQTISTLVDADRYFLDGFRSARFVTRFLASDSALSADYLHINCDFRVSF